MARILVQADDRRTVLLDERSIKPEHMNDRHSAVQLMQRLEWAVRDAERRNDHGRARTRRAGRARAARRLARALD